MWFLPSRGRPKMCQETIDACYQTGMRSPALVYVDNRVDDYPNLKLPDNWTKVLGEKNMGPAMTWCFESFPDEKCYGWLADDLIPKTQGWCEALENAADDWCLADCHDGGFFGEDCAFRLSAAFCWGGELVRAAGGWVLIPVEQGGIDDAWVDVCTRHLKVRQYLKNIVVEHRSWKCGKRKKDATDERCYSGGESQFSPMVHNDMRTLYDWRKEHGDQLIAGKVIDAMKAAGVLERYHK